MIFTFFLIIWLFKNFLISGCLIFPIETTCFSNLQWSNNFAFEQNISTEAWSKGYPDSDMSLKPSIYINQFLWFQTWSNHHLHHIAKKLMPIMLFLTIFLTLINKKNFKFFYNKDIFFMLFFLVISILIWFLNFPVYRLGSGFIQGFFAVTIFLFLHDCNKINFSKIAKYMIIILIVIVSLKNLNRIIKNFKINYENYPWVKIYSNNGKKLKYKKTSYLNDKNSHYYIADSESCFYGPSPCGYTEEKLKIYLSNGYKIIGIN